MEYTENTSIFEYAEYLGCPKVLNFYDAFKFLLKDINCIVCKESAADLMGYSNGGFRNNIYVYAPEELNLPFIKCFIVKSLDDIPYIDYKGVKVSPIEQAIVDMLASDTTDPQVLFETHANYYFENNESYEGLDIPQELKERSDFFRDGGMHYYDV